MSWVAYVVGLWALLPPGFAFVEYPPAPVPRACIAFAGDVMHHRSQYEGAGGDEARTLDYSGAFAALAPVLREADLAVANLETPLDGIHPHHFYPRFSAPEALAAAMAEAGIDLVSVANNHALDRGEEGLARTLETLSRHGIHAVGAVPGATLATLEVNGLRVGFLGATAFVNECCPCRTSPCPLLFPERGPHALLEALVRNAAADHDAVIVLLHWMDEYRKAPLRRERRLAHALVAAGAAAVMGSHSHVLGPFERFQHGNRLGYIRYSLGNFVTGMKPFPETSGAVDLLCLKKGPEGVVVTRSDSIPIWVRRDVAGQRNVFRAVPLADLCRQCGEEDPPLGATRCRAVGAYCRWAKKLGYGL